MYWFSKHTIKLNEDLCRPSWCIITLEMCPLQEKAKNDVRLSPLGVGCCEAGEFVEVEGRK